MLIFTSQAFWYNACKREVYCCRSSLKRLVRVALPLYFAAVMAEGGIVFDAPGFVYAENENVTASGGASGSVWALSDWRGRILSEGRWDEGGRVKFGKLSVGYYRLLGGGASATFAVVPDPRKRIRIADSFVAVDAALSWCWRPSEIDCPWYGGQSYRLGQDLLERCGVAHVRERMSWSEVEPTRGSRCWGRYLKNAHGLRARGMRVSGMFHDAPKWAQRIRKLPGDLVALRDYCAATVRTFGDCMEDWEFWNEPDIGFAPEGAWDFAACQKAAFLGFRQGDPTMVVAPGAVCRNRRGDYDELLYDNGLAYYSDVFNFHTYAPLAEYSAFHVDLRAFMKGKGIEGRAVWVTECGTQQEGHSVNDGAHKGQKAASWEQELVWAEFLPKSQICQLFQGVSRTYTFVMAAYNEADGAKDWGLMRRDGTVKPAYNALSTLAYEVGSAKLEGSLTFAAGRVQGFLFRQPDGSRTLAFWTLSPLDETGKTIVGIPPLETPFTLRATGAYRLTDLCGQTAEVRASAGRLALTASRYPAYLSGLHDELFVTQQPFPCGRVGALPPSADMDLSVVLRIDPDAEDFALGAGKSQLEMRRSEGRVRVTVWNLSDTSKRGSVEAVDRLLTGLPDEMEVPANSCAVFDANVSITNVEARLCLIGHFNGRRSTPLVARLFNEVLFRSQCRESTLDVLKSARWSRNTSASKYAQAYDDKERAFRFEAAWEKPGDRWFYPVYRLSDDESSAGAAMLEFEVKIAQDKVENDVGTAVAMFGETGDSAIFCPYRAPHGEWEVRRVEIPARIRQKGFRWFRLGCNPKGTRLTFWVRNVKLLSPRN